MNTSQGRTGSAGSLDRTWPASRSLGRSYADRWRQVPGTLVYLVLTTIVGWVAFAVLLSLGVTSLSLLIFTVGIFIWWFTVLVATGFGTLERRLLTMTGLPEIQEPVWREAGPGAGIFSKASVPSTDPHRWTTWLHAMLVGPILGTVTMTVAISWAGTALFSLTEWFWGTFWDFESGLRWLVQAMPFIDDTTSHWVTSGISFGIGAVLLVTLPLAVTGMADLHHVIARSMLGRWESDDLVVLTGDVG